MPLDLGRQHLDVDSRQVLGQRLAPGRLAARMRVDLLLHAASGERRFELGALALVEHHRQHVERELRSRVRQML
ncbi:MAG TPA: hypothetical protein VE987_01090 [Polyangiaceae bacterium]|nr:hypothetical protein [Polyangiaceae bacterium]